MQPNTADPQPKAVSVTRGGGGVKQPEDRFTAELPGLDVEPAKRRPGRPRKPDALTPAERARAYRARMRERTERARRMVAAGVRYMSAQTWETWTGRGPAPAWFRAATADPGGENIPAILHENAAQFIGQYLGPEAVRQWKNSFRDAP